MLLVKGENKMDNRLKEMRKKRAIKVETLTDYLRISAVYYYDLEKGQRRLNEDVLHKLADFYQVTLDYLLCRTEAENNIIVEGDKIPSELKGYIDAMSIDKDNLLSPDDLRELIEVAIKLKRKN
jgi:transcriptional regulator with XRE-family HTH domain